MHLIELVKDKVKINSLTMIAGDYAESKSSAASIYQVIRERLLATNRDNMLPLVYLLDSILKNVRGFFIDIVQDDAANWMPKVYCKLQDVQQAKLKKVWVTWEEFNLFSTDAWRAMGSCFGSQSGSILNSSLSDVAGIARTVSTYYYLVRCTSVVSRDVCLTHIIHFQKDGSLVLSTVMRTEMQNILDELQNDVANELEKVSLERLADMNPDLLANIKRAAEENMKGKVGNSGGSHSDRNDSVPSFFTETRPAEMLKRSAAWKELKWDHLAKTHEVVSKLQTIVRQKSTSDERYSQTDAMETIHFLAAASVTSSLLTEYLQEWKNQQDRKDHKKRLSFPGASNLGMTGSGAFLVDKKNFTNEGIRTKNPAIIGLLYEIGLPFFSSADGQRFRSEIELSNHLDALFKKNKLDKSMATTEERGWYVAESLWTKESKEVDTGATGATTDTAWQEDSDGYDPETSTMPADEYRDCCVVCGINFQMFFDNDDGMYKYRNCREIEVLNDDASEKESESMLLHVSCWRGLGSPEILTIDQTLQETMRLD
jgi:pre-mRNA cleavage complex 2 protein Pcf11